ncbi:MAG: helix-turn-helix domain-containing protein [Ruminococcaceae bacterium]|nr:helix-turn-helix domain-containing protein [Oscillospiraceae bacterium]
MSFNKKVVKLLKEKKKTKAQLAKAAGIPYTTLDSMLKRDSDSARIKTVYKIAEYLDVSIEELVFDEQLQSVTSKNNITDEEYALLESYRLIDERGKSTISALLNLEVGRKNQLSMALNNASVRKIPVYMSPAAAGEPLPILADDYSMVRTIEAPEEATFGIRISGDSMEPVIYDSSVVWVKKQETLQPGEIGIFLLNGESLCKRLEYYDGNCTLISLNPKYKPIEVFENDDLRVVGKVLM